jgi:hypothetical protein
MPDPQPQQVTVVGPDKKTYKFPAGTTKDKAIAYFKKKGISASVKQSAEDAAKVSHIFGTDKGITGDIPKGPGSKDPLPSINKDAVDAMSKGLPAAGGAGFGVAAGKKTNPVGMAMSGLGGMAGASANEIIQRLMFNRSGDNVPTGSNADTNFNTAGYILGEGIKQAGLEGAGRYGGKLFFKLLNKIPHAAIINGIKFFPSELNGGKITKYVEDILANLAPSAGIWNKAKLQQNSQLIGETEKLAEDLAEGFSRFGGTTEEMGKLLQDTYRSISKVASGDGAVYDRLALAKTAAKKKTAAAAVEAYEKEFKTQLADQIIKTNKPELIGGYIRSDAPIEDVRKMVSTLEEHAPETLNSTRTRIMRDILQETLTGKTDPISKGLQKQNTQFVGKKLKDVLDSIGEDKLKALYGEERFNKIEEFAQLVDKTGGTQSGVGRFLNLGFIVPFRNGLTINAALKLSGSALVLNRLAKVMTSTEGMRLYENEIRAGTTGSVKAISAARDEFRVYMEKQDKEIVDEKKATEDEYYKEHPDEVKYRK